MVLELFGWLHRFGEFHFYVQGSLSYRLAVCFTLHPIKIENLNEFIFFQS